MSHSFTVTVTDEGVALLDHTAAAITKNGGKFEGDKNAGSFKGNSVLGPVGGQYCRISETEIRFTITEKPFLVPYSIIEAEITKYFV
ncbi:MAG: hypothetical protein C0402_11035 [Thermodesulfovibrio sp.]|nr:hypothetical protein [Thermodesulfovibrio sp.]